MKRLLNQYARNRLSQYALSVFEQTRDEKTAAKILGLSVQQFYDVLLKRNFSINIKKCSYLINHGNELLPCWEIFKSTIQGENHVSTN